jgi:DNA-binding beta-propeller fold protein YncE
MKTLLHGAVLLGLMATAPSPAVARAPAQPAQPAPCVSVTAVPLVCGQQGPEDLYALPGDRWVVASAMTGSGGLNLVRVSDRTSTRLYPSPAAKEQYDAKAYPGCPGPPGAAGAMFTTHGLWLEPGTGATRRLYVVGHGTRESIEVFTLDTRGPIPVVTWIGCAIAPDPIGLNSVRGLPDGGFIASNFLARGVSAAERQKLFAGEKNGELWEWHAASGWQKVPGSEASGANGLELSGDGSTLYVAAWGSQSFFRLSRGRTPVERQEIPLGFRVDNLHRARDGSLFAAGQGQGVSAIVRIDPKTLTVTKVVTRPDDASFSGGTVAIEVGNRLWVGSFGGDRIALLTR